MRMSQFSSVQDGICTLRKTHKRFSPSLFPQQSTKVGYYRIVSCILVYTRIYSSTKIIPGFFCILLSIGLYCCIWCEWNRSPNTAVYTPSLPLYVVSMEQISKYRCLHSLPPSVYGVNGTNLQIPLFTLPPSLPS